jgi:uncharacterized iron-regulated protein
MAKALGRFVAVAIMAMMAQVGNGFAAADCSTAGSWLAPAQREAVSADAAMASLSERQVVLLGESHENADDHRWQLQVLAALHGRRPDMRIGLEMFPRAAQPILDRWVAGELTPKAFLEEVEWDRVWGYNSKFYMPIFEFSRMNGVPLVAINIPRSLVARVGDEGWSAIPAEERHGVGDAARAPAPYEDMLADVYVAKSRMAAGADHEQAMAPASAAERAALAEEPGFQHFVEAQLTWDRAMAEALAGAATEAPLVVGLVGRGHAEGGHGIAHQLRDLGIDNVGIAVTASDACAEMPDDVADLVFVTAASDVVEAPGPRLGVMIEAATGGVSIRHVVPESVAATAGIEQSDVITEAAGFPLNTPGDLIQIVRRQAPGTWLPLVLSRGDDVIELVAKFPTEF